MSTPPVEMLDSEIAAELEKAYGVPCSEVLFEAARRIRLYGAREPDQRTWQRRIERERDGLRAEVNTHAKRIAELEAQLVVWKANDAQARMDWNADKECASQVIDVFGELTEMSTPLEAAQDVKKQLEDARERVRELECEATDSDYNTLRHLELLAMLRVQRDEARKLTSKSKDEAIKERTVPVEPGKVEDATTCRHHSPPGRCKACMGIQAAAEECIAERDRLRADVSRIEDLIVRADQRRFHLCNDAEYADIMRAQEVLRKLVDAIKAAREPESVGEQ